MSKAFTKEDDDAGFALPDAGASVVPPGPFRLTVTGARLLRERASRADGGAELAIALGRAEVQAPVVNPARGALGVTVRVQTESGEERRYRLVSAEERALLGDGCSLQSPVGRALLGAEVGDVREVAMPKGPEELSVVALSGEAPDAQ